MASASSTNVSAVSFKSRIAEKKECLKQLHQKRNEARKLNHLEVCEEDKRAKLPSNWETKRHWAQHKLDQEDQRRQAQEKGEDYERQKLLHVSAEEAEQWEKKKRKKYNPDPGFSNYEAATVRQYNRLVKNMKPSMEEYNKEKDKLGEAFYAERNTIVHGRHVDTQENIDRMVEDLEKQISKRDKFSRRRTHDDDADIDYINNRNMKFNKKLERFYGQYTGEIKQNLERGTAV